MYFQQASAMKEPYFNIYKLPPLERACVNLFKKLALGFSHSYIMTLTKHQRLKTLLSTGVSYNIYLYMIEEVTVHRCIT